MIYATNITLRECDGPCELTGLFVDIDGVSREVSAYLPPSEAARFWRLETKEALILAAEALTPALLERWPGATVGARTIGDVFAIVVDTPEAPEIGRTKRYTAEIVRYAEEITTLMASRPMDPAMVAELLGMLGRHTNNIQAIALGSQPRTAGAQ